MIKNSKQVHFELPTSDYWKTNEIFYMWGVFIVWMCSNTPGNKCIDQIQWTLPEIYPPNLSLVYTPLYTYEGLVLSSLHEKRTIATI